MKFVFEPNFYNFEYQKSELGLDWLLQHFSLLQLTQFTSMSHLLSI
jgi:hypothetical protein